jgi:hypothetical protein
MPKGLSLSLPLSWKRPSSVSTFFPIAIAIDIGLAELYKQTVGWKEEHKGLPMVASLGQSTQYSQSNDQRTLGRAT